jgi:glycosyltransferase involved in cell wall biosynthesis
MLRSYSVIVPVLNGADALGATLDSIGRSMAFFDEHHPRAGEIAGEVVVVDDGSTDATPETARRAARYDPRVRLVAHHRSFGIGPARNTGVRASSGDVLIFCDGDDFFLPEHILAGFSILEASDGATEPATNAILLRVGTRGHLALSPSASFAAVRTGVRLADAILPEWQAVMQNTIAQCLCLRRECHDWIEGFPEAQVYKQIGGCEDGAYALAVNAFFRVGVIDLETVEYVRRPGNSLDRQMLRYTHPAGSAFDTASPAQAVIHAVRRRLEAEKLGYLLDKWRVLGPPALPARFLNWPSVVSELIRRHQPDAAREVAEQASQLGQSLPDELMRELATRGRVTE